MELDVPQHRHILGKEDTLTLAQSLFLQNKYRLLIDPIGSVSLDLADIIPDAILWDFTDDQHPITVNPLYDIPDDQKSIVTDALKDMFLNVWYGDFQATNVIDCLYNSIAALLDDPNGTLLGIKYMLTSPQYRKNVLYHVSNPVVRSYWLDEFEKLPPRDRYDLTKATRANIHQIVADNRLARIFGMPKPRLNLKDIIDNKKTLLIRIPQSTFGRRKTRILVSLILSMIHQAARQRTKQHQYHVYLLRAGLYASETLIDAVATIAEHNLSLTIVHNYLTELDPTLYASLDGLIAERYITRTGKKDAHTLDADLPPSGLRWPLDQLLPNTYRHYTATTNFDTLLHDPPLPTVPEKIGSLEIVRQNSRRQYAEKRASIDRYLTEFSGAPHARTRTTRDSKARVDLSDIQ